MTDLNEPDVEATLDNSSMPQNEQENNSSQSAWKDFSEEDNKYIGQKGWKAPADILKSYRELEKVSSSKVSIPNDGDEQSWKKLYSKLGMPEKAEDMDIEVEETYKKELQNIFFKNNILPQNAKGLIKDYEEFSKAQKEAADKLIETQSEKERDEVLSEWGDDVEKNKELMTRGAKLLGLEDEVLSTLELAIGTKNFMQSMLKLGVSISEDNIPNPSKAGKSDEPQELVDWLKTVD